MTQSHHAKKHFTQKVSGICYMTPQVIEYGWVYPKKISYELSEGTGTYEGEKLYGVTTSRFTMALSMAWFSREQAEAYLRYLRARISWRLMSNGKAKK